ncbi:MAG: response regulator [Rhodomicrobium sp.]
MTAAPSSSAGPATILVVDDDVLVRFAIADYLRDCGYRVIEGASGKEAIRVIEKSDVNVDVVLCDAELTGGVNGFNLAQWIRANRTGLPVILAGTPAKASDAAAELCDEGPNLARPYEPQLVVDRIKRLLAKRGQSKA